MLFRSAVGDWIVDQSGAFWICTTAGTPGTWTSVGGTAGGTAGGDLTGTYPNPTLVTTTYAGSSPVGSGTAVPVVTVNTKGLITATSTAATVGTVTAGDTSIVMGGTATAPTVATGTLDVIATQHAPAANWSNNSKKITSLLSATAATDAPTYAQTNSFWAPRQQNLIAASVDPALSTSTLTVTAGTIYYTAVWVPQATTITNILYAISTGGGTTANCYVGLYNASGTQLGVSANLGTAWGTTGTYTTAMSSTATISTPGLYYVAFVAGTSTSLAFRSHATATLANLGATFSANTLAGGGRGMTGATGQTTLPSSVSGTPAALTQPIFAALS